MRVCATRGVCVIDWRETDPLFPLACAVGPVGAGRVLDLSVTCAQGVTGTAE